MDTTKTRPSPEAMAEARAAGREAYRKSPWRWPRNPYTDPDRRAAFSEGAGEAADGE